MFFALEILNVMEFIIFHNIQNKLVLLDLNPQK